MVASKKVSGHGRDQALNLLSKNVPRKDKKERDNSRTLFTIDHGEPDNCIRSLIRFEHKTTAASQTACHEILICIFMYICVRPPGLKKILKVCGQVPELPDQLPLTDNTQLIASVLLNKLYDDLKCDPERTNFREICDEYVKYVYKMQSHREALWPRLRRLRISQLTSSIMLFHFFTFVLSFVVPLLSLPFPLDPKSTLTTWTRPFMLSMPSQDCFRVHLMLVTLWLDIKA